MKASDWRLVKGDIRAEIAGGMFACRVVGIRGSYVRVRVSRVIREAKSIVNMGEHSVRASSLSFMPNGNCCEECGERLLIVDGYFACPRFHGRLREVGVVIKNDERLVRARSVEEMPLGALFG